MIGRAALAILMPLLLLGNSLAAAEAGITVIASDVDVDFPDRAVFTVEAESSVDIVDARLCYHVNRMNYAEVISEGWTDFVPATTVEADWVWDMTNAGLPPGAEVTYWWVIEDADGNRVETPPETMHFDDSRFSWQSLTGSVPGGEAMTLSWYTGDNSFAQELMDTCEAGLDRLTQDIGAYLEQPAKIYVYASTSDLRGAMVFSQEWTGGVAFIDFGIIAISIPPSDIERGKKALVHELTHLVVRQATFSPYGQLPLWLDEGLATYNEGELEPVLRSYLDEAILNDELISVRSLCSPFSAYPGKAYLSYAESYSIVEYLLDDYGQSKMLGLLTLLKQGNTYDEALTEVYGFDIDGLDTRWRATLASDAVVASEASSLHPALMAALSASAAGFATWGALVLKKRTRRRSSGASVMQDKL
jgi:hypothetical protein